MKEYKSIFKAFTAYCYKNVDSLKWKSFRNDKKQYRYFRTKLKDLNIIVGLNLTMNTYFLSIKGLGDIGNKKHRLLFPSKLQRLFIALLKIEKRDRYEQTKEQQ